MCMTKKPIEETVMPAGYTMPADINKEAALIIEKIFMFKSTIIKDYDVAVLGARKEVIFNAFEDFIKVFLKDKNIEHSTTAVVLREAICSNTLEQSLREEEIAMAVKYYAKMALEFIVDSCCWNSIKIKGVVPNKHLRETVFVYEEMAKFIDYICTIYVEPKE